MDASTAAAPGHGRLLKILGVTFGVAIAIGGAVGSGILRNPGIVAQNLGSAWLILGAWLLGGIFSLMGANTYAELSTSVPEDGGPYVFLRRAYGNFIGFAGGATDFIQNCCSIAYLSITFGEYLGTVLPTLAGKQNYVGVGLLLMLTLLNWIGVRAGEIAAKITSLFKLIAFCTFAVACFILGSQNYQEVPAIAAVTSHSSPWLIFGGVALAMNSVMGTYAGWNAPVYFSEENRNSTRNLPRALFGGVFLVMCVYLLVNIALLYAMPVANIAASKLPAADFAAAVIGAKGGTLITCLALCSIIGILNAALMYVPRIMFALSRAGFLPEQLSDVNTGGTPAKSLFLTVAIALAFAFSGTYETLLEIATFLVLAADSAVYLAIFILRKKEPDLERPFKAVGYPILPGIVLLAAWFLLGLFVIGNTANSLYALGILVMLGPIYLLLRMAMKRTVRFSL